MKKDYPNLYKHCKGILKRKDGVERLKRALRSIKEDTFYPSSWWSSEGKGWLSAHCLTGGERKESLKEVECCFTNKESISVRIAVRRYLGAVIAERSKPYQLGNSVDDQTKVGYQGVKDMIRYVLKEQ